MSLWRVALLPGIVVLAATCEELIDAVSASAALTAITDEHLPLAEMCVPRLIKSGYWEVATALITKRGDVQLTNKEELQQIGMDAKKRADKFIQSLEASNRIQTVTPAMQWGQSPEKLFLDIKFAHRFDAPGCIEIKDQKIDFQKTSFKLSALCTMSSHKLKYVVDFELYDEVNPDACTYSMSSVGRMSVTLEKVTKGYWKQPMKGKKPANMQIWWEMKKKYKKDMKSYYPEGEDDDDDDEDKDKKKD